MRLSIILQCVLLMMSGVSLAQDEKTGYEIAQERIAEAKENEETTLALHWLGLTEVPSEIGDVTSLTWLYMIENYLTELPVSIGQLSNLEVLTLSGNQLTELPESIGRLSNLRILDLSGNQLTELPESIGQLSNLEMILLADNQLTELPESISKLSNLRLLHVENNQLRDLPNNIGELYNLQSLLLDDNRIVQLPQSMRQLSNLCLLNLVGNQLNKLPIELASMKRLLDCDDDYILVTGLYFDDYLLNDLPDEVVAGGTGAILDYLENQVWWHTQRIIMSIASGVGMIVAFILFVRWRNRRIRKPKSKRREVGV